MSKLSKANILKVKDILLEEYKGAECALNHENVFQLLVATVLSAQTTDASVNKITPALFEKAPDAFELSKLSFEDIENLIHSIGMYRQKAKNILNLSKILCRDYEGNVPRDFDALTALPGVGRKTANVVLAVGFHEQRIAVDTHVFRLANRIGLAEADNVLAVEKELMKCLPEENWTDMHHALIYHGRRVCSAKKPDCQSCCIKNICKMNLL